MSLAISAAPWTNDNITNTNTTRRRSSNMKKTLKNRAYSNDEKQLNTSNNDIYSSIDIYENNDLENKNTFNKNDIQKGANMHEILNKINRYDAIEKSELTDFNPPPHAEISKKTDENYSKENFENNNIPLYVPQTPPYSKISAANDLGLYANYKQSYDSKGVGYFSNNKTNNLGNVQDKLMEKVNYIIHMLEIQQHEKTNNVTEELILYTFLGIFIIFICDTFALVGKYHR